MTGIAGAAGTFAFGGDHRVNRMGYGAMRLSGPQIMGPPADPDEAVAVLRAAVEAGVNHIDTSDYYGPFTVNELIREALHPYPEDLLLVTKVGARRTAQGGWLPAISGPELVDAVHDNLRRLDIDRIGAVNLRLPDAVGGDQDPDAIVEPFAVLAELQRQGKIRHLGVSNVGPRQLAAAQQVAPVACVQNAYNIVLRGADQLVDSCAAQGIAFVPFFPLGGFSPLAADAFGAVATELGHTTMQLALAWLLHRSPAILTVAGTGRRAHLAENLQAALIRLDADQLARLEQAAQG